MASYIIDVDHTRTDDGTEAVAEFYVVEADKSTYLPDLYTVPYDPNTGLTWLPSEISGVRNILVKDVSIATLAAGVSYRVTITANNYITVAQGSSEDNMLDDVVWEYPQSELFFDFKWFGIQRLQSDRYLPFDKYVVKTASTTPALSIGLYGQYKHYLKYDSSEDNWTGQSGPTDKTNIADKGSFVFKNSKPAIFYMQARDSNGKTIEQGTDPDTGYKVETVKADGDYQVSKGSAVYTDSPFDTTSLQPSINWVGQKIPMLTGIIVFYVKARKADIAIFQGVNGANGFPKRCKPFDSAAGKWRAKDQNIKEVRDNEGDEWLRITRTMEYAPGTLVWSADKNGGTWSW